MIIQERFDIPEDVAVGLADGTLRRLGGVVRIAEGAEKGQIYKMLDPIDIDDDDDVSEKVALAKESVAAIEDDTIKTIVIITVTVAAVTATTVAGFMLYKRYKFKKAFREYIGEVRTGTLRVETIDNLQNVLDGIKKVKLSAEELALLVSHIHDYTVKLANDNNVQFEIEESNDSIIDFKEYLQVQKEVLLKEA